MKNAMERTEALSRLRGEADRLRQAGISRLYLFGSTARGDATSDSDVDLFFETDDPRFSLIELVRARRLVSDILGAEADLMTRGSLHPAFRKGIEAGAVRVF